MKIIDGKKISQALRAEIRLQAQAFTKKTGREPGLAIVIAGDDPASCVYVKNKLAAASEAGIKSFYYSLPETVKEGEVITVLDCLAKNPEVDGILVQLPLPKHLNEKRILSRIPDEKDVDGFSPGNMGLLAMGTPRTISCTPYGVMKLLRTCGIEVAGKNAVVIGRSNIVGKPMAMLLTNANATVTICHSRTKDIAAYTKKADLIVVAVGIPHFLKADTVKKGAVVIDVGINRLDGKLVGDVDFEQVGKRCSYITPVPGGVGPMTITMLLQNTLDLANGQGNNS